MNPANPQQAKAGFGRKGKLVGEKVVKVCDRCGAESILYNTASWETCTFHKLRLGNPEGDAVKYDLCGKCATAVKVSIIEAQKG